MRNRATLIAAFTLVCGSAAACSDARVPAGPTVPGAARLARDGASGGADIDRNLAPYGHFGRDPETGLVIFAGPADPVAAAAIKCPDPRVIAPIDPGARVQTVRTPSGRVMRHGYNDAAPVAVWAYPAGPVTSFCQVAGAPLLARGTVRFNSQYSVDADGPGAAVAHYKANGVVDLVAGGRARLHLDAMQVFGPDGTLLREETRVTLTPLAAGS
jgi:hypothetical protein